MRLRRRGRLTIGLAGVLLAGCGGTSTSTSTSTVGSSGVSVQVTSPADNSVINADNVTVRGTVDPPSASVQVDGQPAAVGNGVFSANEHLGPGKTTIDVIGSAPGRSPGSTTVVVSRPTPGGTAPTTTTAGAANASGGPTSCGGGLSAGPNTSCAFATNVESTYRAQGPGTYVIYSPATGGNYTMTCTENNGNVVCTGGNDASVYFPG